MKHSEKRRSWKCKEEYRGTLKNKFLKPIQFLKGVSVQTVRRAELTEGNSKVKFLNKFRIPNWRASMSFWPKPPLSQLSSVGEADQGIATTYLQSTSMCNAPGVQKCSIFAFEILKGFPNFCFRFSTEKSLFSLDISIFDFCRKGQFSENFLI